MPIFIERQQEVVHKAGVNLAYDAVADESLRDAASALETAFRGDASAVLADMANAAIGRCTLDPALNVLDRASVPVNSQSPRRVVAVVSALEELLGDEESAQGVQNGAHILLGQLALAYSPQYYPPGRRRARQRGIQERQWRRGEAYFAAAREVIARHCIEGVCRYSVLNDAMIANPHVAYAAGWGKDVRGRNVRTFLANNLVLVGAALAESECNPEPPRKTLQVSPTEDTVYQVPPKAERLPGSQDECLHTTGELYTETEEGRAAELDSQVIKLMQLVPWLDLRGIEGPKLITTILYEGDRRIARIIDCTPYNQVTNVVAVAARRNDRGRKHANNAVLRGARFHVGEQTRLKSVSLTTFPLRYYGINHQGGASTRAYFSPVANLDAIPTVLLLGLSHGKTNEGSLLRVFAPGIRQRPRKVQGTRGRVSR